MSEFFAPGVGGVARLILNSGTPWGGRGRPFDSQFAMTTSPTLKCDQTTSLFSEGILRTKSPAQAVIYSNALPPNRSAFKSQAEAIVSRHCEESTQIACLIHLCEAALTQFSRSGQADLHSLQGLGRDCIEAYIRANSICRDCVQSALSDLRKATSPELSAMSPQGH